MGYASVLPFQMLNVNFDNVSTDELTLSAIPQDTQIATITTPIWRYSPTYAYFNILVNYRNNLDALENYINNSAGGCLALTVDDVVFQSCGTWKQGDMWTAPTTIVYGQHKLLGTTNIASYIKANTVYKVYVQNVRAEVDGPMNLRNLSLELVMTFNI